VAAGKWITVAPGIRCRDHDTRLHGIKPDRYFAIRHTADAKQTEEGLGWASDGWTLRKAQAQLSLLLEAKRTGSGETTMAEKRRKAEAERKIEADRQKGEKTVTELWKRYLVEVVAKNKARTAADKAAMWKRHVGPALGRMKVKDVTQDDAGAVVRSPLKLNAAGRIVKGNAQAGNLYRFLHAMFNKAQAWGWRARALGNPLEEVEEPKVARRERLLSAGEVTALLRTLDAAAADGTEQPTVAAAIKLAVLTGARIGEIIGLEWDHVRADEMELHLPDTKTGFSARPVSADALAVIASVKRMPGVPFVFRAIESPTESMGYNTIEGAFRRTRDRAGLKKCTLHTIRHWFVTQTANSVSNPRVGMRLTGHKSVAAYTGYVHADAEQARELVGKMEALTKALGNAPSNVKKLPVTKP
jgi:integrase